MDGGGALPRGGRQGFVEFKFPDDGWTIFLTSANGADDFNNDLTPIFNATLPKYYGAEYDVDERIANRLKEMVLEMEEHRRFRRPIVVHCNHGRTRSVICIGAYLMKHYPNLTSDEVVKILKSIFVSAVEDVNLNINPVNNVVPHFHTIGERVERALLAFEQFRN